MGRRTFCSGEIYLLALFAGSRILYFLAGLRFNAGPISTFWQMIDPVLMRTDLLRSIWYLHMQPPGYNLALGLVVKFFPSSYGAVLWAAQTIMGAAIAVCLFRLMCRLNVSAVCSWILTALFVISPGCVLFENTVGYEYPALLLLLLSALALAGFCEKLTTPWAVAFFGCLLVLMLIRNAFHIVYFLTVAAGLFWFVPLGRRGILLAALPVLAIMAAISIKNGLLFGRLTDSTWAGMGIGVTTTGQLTEDEAKDLIRGGILSPLAAITAFSDLSQYKPHIRMPPRTGIPILDQEVTSTGHPNFNNLAYLQIHDQYLADSFAIWRHYPAAYLRSLQIVWFSYFRPAGDPDYFSPAPARIKLWDRVFNIVVFGELREANGENFRDLGEDGYHLSRLLYMGLFLAVIIPATVIWCAAQFFVRRWKIRWTRAQLIVLAYMLFTIVWITLLSTLFSTYDGFRYRFPLDGFFMALVGGMLAQILRRSV